MLVMLAHRLFISLLLETALVIARTPGSMHACSACAEATDMQMTYTCMESAWPHKQALAVIERW